MKTERERDLLKQMRSKKRTARMSELIRDIKGIERERGKENANSPFQFNIIQSCLILNKMDVKGGKSNFFFAQR